MYYYIIEIGNNLMHLQSIEYSYVNLSQCLNGLSRPGTFVHLVAVHEVFKTFKKG